MTQQVRKARVASLGRLKKRFSSRYRNLADDAGLALKQA
jgi:hypothetical protein